MPAEFLTIELYKAYGLEAYRNDAPEEDYEGRASHDIVVAGQLHDVKADFWAGKTKRIFVEKNSLEHTKAYWFDYWLPTPYGYDVRVFTREQLTAFYNAQNRIQRGDGTFHYSYVYLHGVAGEQANNEGCFIPMDVVKAEGLPPWMAVKIIKQQTQ